MCADEERFSEINYQINTTLRTEQLSRYFQLFSRDFWNVDPVKNFAFITVYIGQITFLDERS
jgi:hypothetical protein